MRYLLKAFTALLLANAAVGGSLLFALRSPVIPPPRLYLSGEVDGSGYRLQLSGKYSAKEIDELKSVISARLESLDNHFSLQRPESESARLFSAPANVPFVISDDFVSLLMALIRIERLTHGTFKPFCTVQSPSLWFQHEYLWQGNQCAEYQAGASALLYFGGHSVIPIMPIALRLQRLLDGMRADSLANELELHGIMSYRIEMGGMLRVGREPWPIAMESGHNARVENGALVHGHAVDGNEFWVAASNTMAGAEVLEALSVLSTREGLWLARQRHWSVRWVSARNDVVLTTYDSSILSAGMTPE